MVFLNVVVRYDDLEWSMVVDDPAQTVAELRRWLSRAGEWQPIVFWPDYGERSVWALAYGRSDEPAPAVRAAFRRLAPPLPLGRIFDVQASEAEDDDDLLQEASLRVLAAFPPGGRPCQSCGGPPGSHFPGCPWAR